MKPPLSERLATALLLEMASGNYQSEMRFFSHRQIMKNWRVSCPVASRSLQLLTQWGVLTVSDRSGHYLVPDFREKALALVNRSSSAPLLRQPHFRSKLFSLQENASHRRIAIVLVLDENLRPAKYKNVPRGIACSATSLTARAIFDESRRRDLTVDFYIDHGDGETHRHILAQIEGTPSLLGAIVVRRIFSSGVAPLASSLLQKGIPVVTAYDDCKRTNMVSLNFNNFGIGYAATNEFLSKGHRHIGVIHRLDAEYFTDRLLGAQLAAKEFQGATAKVVSILVRDTEEIMDHPCRKYFRRDYEDRITAVLGTDAYSLAKLHPLIRKEGLSIPEDLSAIVCSSTPSVPLFRNPIDIMHLDFAGMGRSAFHALETLVSGKSFAPYLLLNADYQPHGSTRSLLEA